MTIREKALDFHARGFNCAQSVLCSCGAYTGLDEQTALALSGGFGGGCRCGEICGAVTGAIMAVGLCSPYCVEGDQKAKEKIAALSRALTSAFREKFNALRCEEIKIDMVHCNAYIEYMAELVEQTIKENQNNTIQERKHGSL